MKNGKMVMSGLVAGGLVAGAAALLGGVSLATANAEPGVTVSPSGSRYYGDQDDRNAYAYLAELRDVGLSAGNPVGIPLVPPRGLGRSAFGGLKARPKTG